MKALFIPKNFGTYADTFFMLGLAQLVEYGLRVTGQKTEMQLMDVGNCYRIQFVTDVDLEAIGKLPYTNPFPPVFGAKTDRTGLPLEEHYGFDVVEQVERRKRYREYQVQHWKLESREDAPDPPDPRTQNGAILTSLRHDRNHNSLWQGAWQLQDTFGALIVALLKTFGQVHSSPLNAVIDRVAKQFQQQTGRQFPDQASAVKIYLPTAVQGVNRVKADSNKVDSQKTDWLSLWLLAGGFFEFGLSERVKVAESTYDWRTVALEPRDISLKTYRDVLNELRKNNPPGGGHGVARFDAELALKLSQALLDRHPAKVPHPADAPASRRRKSVKDFVAGLRGTHFNSKGQVYGVKEVFSLGLPGWICPETPDEVIAYQTVVQEHLSVVRSLSAEDGHSELLAAYRDFITGTDLSPFFRFQVSYADYIVKRLANASAKFPPPRFSQAGLDIMIQSDKSDQTWSVTEITQNPGFLRIARAINSATVYAGKIRTKDGPVELDWQRTYGLAQRLGNQAGSKRDFIAELTAFLTGYENENLRISEQLQKEGKVLKRIWVTNEDLEQFLALLDDKRFNCYLVANLLLAYGYANWKKPLVDEPPDAPVVEDETHDHEANL